MPGIVTPGQMQVGVTHAAAPLAQPVTMALQGPGHAQLMVWGGLSKRQVLAGMACAMIPDSTGIRSVEELTRRAIDIADAILAQTEPESEAIDPGTAGEPTNILLES